jgi:DNA-binding phage protein
MKKDFVAPAVPYRDYLLKRLQDPATAAAYLNEAASDNDPAAFLQALRNVIDASGGIAKIAARTDLNRQAVYRIQEPAEAAKRCWSWAERRNG